MVPLGNRSNDISFRRALARAPAPQSWENVSSSEEGYCYLCLYREKVHQQVAQLLGMYPLWREVKQLGGFRVGGAYHVSRTGENLVHIGSEGTGYTVSNLQIRDDDRVGGRIPSGYSTFYPTFAWRPALLVWAIWVVISEFRQKISATKMALATIAVVYPAWYVELAFGRLHVPIIRIPKGIKVEPDLVRVTRRSGFAKLIKLVVTFGVMTIPDVAEARLTTKPGDLNKFEFTPEVRKIVTQVHGQYLATHNLSLPDHAICTTKQSLRLKILDLDIDDEYLIEYVEGMCPQLIGKPGWRQEAEVFALANTGDDFGARANRFLETSIDLIADISGTANRIVAATTEQIVYALQDGGETYVDSLNESRDHIRETAKAGLTAAKAAGNAASQVVSKIATSLERNKDVPGELVDDAFTLLKWISTKLDPVEGFEIVVEHITDTIHIIDNNTIDYDEAVGLAVKAMSTVVGDISELVSESYGQSKAITTDNYRYLKENEGSIRSAVDHAALDAKNTGKEIYNVLKEMIDELQPLEKSKELATVVADLTKIAGEAVGGFPISAVAEVGRLMPDGEQIARGRRAVFGEPVTSQERIEMYNARAKWTIGSWFWAPSKLYPVKVTCGYNEMDDRGGKHSWRK